MLLVATEMVVSDEYMNIEYGIVETEILHLSTRTNVRVSYITVSITTTLKHHMGRGWGSMEVNR